MKKLSYVFSSVIIIILISFLFSGCSSNELTVFDAIIKTNKITSMENKTHISFEATGIDTSNEDLNNIEDSEVLINVLLKILNNSSYTLNQKLIRNENDTITKQQIDAEIDIGDIYTKFNIWTDVNLNEKTPKALEIIKMPKVTSLFFPDKFSGKPYLVLDFNDKDSSVSGIEVVNMAKFSAEIREKVFNFIKLYEKQFEPNYITKKESNESVTVYELKLDNNLLKKLLEYTINNFSESKEAKQFLKEILIILKTVDNTSNSEIEEINKALDEEFPKLKEYSVELLKNLNLLGKKGALIQLSINKDGYIVKQNGTIEINLKEDFSKTLTIKFDSETTNINKDFKIEYPELTSENSFKLLDVEKYFTEQEEKRKKAFEEEEDKYYIYNAIPSVKMDGKRCYFFTGQPVIICDSLMIPLKDFSNEIGADAFLNEENSKVICTKNDKVLEFTIGKKEVLANGEKIELLTEPFISYYGYTFVPLKVLCEQFGYKFDWNQDTLTVNIATK